MPVLINNVELGARWKSLHREVQPRLVNHSGADRRIDPSQRLLRQLVDPECVIGDNLSGSSRAFLEPFLGRANALLQEEPEDGRKNGQKYQQEGEDDRDRRDAFRPLGSSTSQKSLLVLADYSLKIFPVNQRFAKAFRAAFNAALIMPVHASH